MGDSRLYGPVKDFWWGNVVSVTIMPILAYTMLILLSYISLLIPIGCGFFIYRLPYLENWKNLFFRLPAVSWIWIPLYVKRAGSILSVTWDLNSIVLVLSMSSSSPVWCWLPCGWEISSPREIGEDTFSEQAL